MAKKVHIAIEMHEPRSARELKEMLGSLANLEIDEWYDGAGEKGALAVSAAPDVIIVDDCAETSRTPCERFTRLRQLFPKSALFVVSEHTRPEYIVEVMKCGVSQYLLTPVNLKILHTAVEEVRANLGRAAGTQQGQIWSFISSKGGLGATVIAVNTAVALARKRQASVALFDLSLQAGDASVLLDLTAATTISDLSRNYHRLDLSLLRSAMSSHPAGFDFLPAPLEPEDSEEINAEHLAAILALGRQSYDALVVDCPSMRIDERTIEIFKASDKVFVVADLSVTSIRNAARLTQLIERVGIRPAHIEVVVNRYSKAAALSLDEVEKTLKRRIFWLFPNDFDDIVSSINRGEPLVSGRPTVPFAKNVCEFTEKLVNPCNDEAYRGLRGTFGKAI